MAFDTQLGFVLFVKDPIASSKFYEQLFGLKPIEQSPTFALFSLKNVMLGLWSHKTAEPKVTASAGATEIAFSEDNVDVLYNQWKNMDIPMAQPPTEMDFGRTFVALDPDGHRIRIYKLREEQ
jgi:predicted enzyme related to lactoylglutathione lyase